MPSSLSSEIALAREGALSVLITRGDPADVFEFNGCQWLRFNRRKLDCHHNIPWLVVSRPVSMRRETRNHIQGLAYILFAVGELEDVNASSLVGWE